MLKGEKSGRIVVKNGWAMCPICGKGKLLKLLPETAVIALPCKCKLCGQQSIVNIEPEPAAKAPSA